MDDLRCDVSVLGRACIASACIANGGIAGGCITSGDVDGGCIANRGIASSCIASARLSGSDCVAGRKRVAGGDSPDPRGGTERDTAHRRRGARCCNAADLSCSSRCITA